MKESQRADLLAFERRLKEIMRNSEPRQNRWRLVLMIVLTFLVIGSVLLFNDFHTHEERPLVEHLMNNKCFSYSAAVLLILMVIFKAPERAVAKKLYAERTREVLSQFAMSCDDDGNLKFPEPMDSSDDSDEEKWACSMCTGEEEENDDLCIPEEEEKNDIYYMFYDT